MTIASRYRRVATFIVLLVVSWSVMTVLHECGHIVCAWACGGTLREAEIAPWSLPYSTFDPDPLPLCTLWGGPILGVFVPFIVAAMLRRQWLWFIAYFCMLANGVYLAAAWFTGDQLLDTARLLQQGAHPATIGLYCLLTIAIGYVGFRHQCIKHFKSVQNG